MIALIIMFGAMIGAVAVAFTQGEKKELSFGGAMAILGLSSISLLACMVGTDDEARGRPLSIIQAKGVYIPLGRVNDNGNSYVTVKDGEGKILLLSANETMGNFKVFVVKERGEVSEFK